MEPTSAAGLDLGRIPGLAEEPDPPFPVLLRACTSSAVHLETRDAYTPDDPLFLAWLAGDREEFAAHEARPWLDLIREGTRRGGRVRRARVVSAPVTDCIRFEHATTAANIGAGQGAPWLPPPPRPPPLLRANDERAPAGPRAAANG